MAHQLSRKLSRLVPIFLSTLMAYSPAQTNGQQEGCVPSADTGQPVWFQSDHLLWGMSTRPAKADEKVLVVLWFQNQSDTPQSVWTCAQIDHFWAREIGVFDSDGKRVFSRSGSEGRAPDEFTCLRNFPITIPPHTCVHGSFAAPEHDFTRDLSDYYALPPGSYLLVPTLQLKPERWGDIALVALPITVLDAAASPAK